LPFVIIPFGYLNFYKEFLKKTSSRERLAYPQRLPKFLSHFFSLTPQAQRKKFTKKKRRWEISRSAERDQGYAPWMGANF
jgi:hypothetical protein